MFETPLQVQLDTETVGSTTWIVISDLIYNDPKFGKIVVPAGFVTDFASVPRIPVIFELVGADGSLGATVHDYLYHNGTIERKDVDGIFLDILLNSGIGKVRSYMMYYGVRAFGWMYFRK